ncbi:MAG: hypothetical protein Q8N97_05180 [Methanobacteriaceae archaeon]|nr:hypothetical protein [Methanobacteriaceae archaeon]
MDSNIYSRTNSSPLASRQLEQRLPLLLILEFGPIYSNMRRFAAFTTTWPGLIKYGPEASLYSGQK